MVASEEVILAVPQASLAVGLLNDGVEGQLMVEGPPTPLITGATLSVTVIVWLFVEVLPHPSLAVQVRFTEYAFAQLPCVVASDDVIVAVLQASLAVGLLNDGVAGQLIVDGPPTPVIVGAVIS